MRSKLMIPCAATAVACGVALLVAACGSGTGTGSSSGPTGADAIADARAAALVAQMTTAEKIQIVHGVGMPNAGLGGPFPAGIAGAGYIPGISRLGIPGLAMADSAGGVNVANSNATALPAPVALAASWDPTLANAYGALIATELRTLGYGEGLGGGVNLAREPRDGRTFEYMGEDPVLTGTMSAARSNGTQAQKVIATIKHYAMNDQETNRFTSNSVVDERTMRETELLAFELGVTNGTPGNVMCSYNMVNGVYACQNPYLLTSVLKTEWGFKGVVQSDWTANHSTVDSALAGLDEEEPGDISAGPSIPGFTITSYFSTALANAVSAGSVPMTRLNDMVQRKLRTMIRWGVFDSPPTTGGTVDQAAGNTLAQQIEDQSAVLLKDAVASGDTQPVLPLNAGTVSSIVVIGGHADTAVLSGGGSGAVPAAAGNAVSGCVSASALLSTCATWYKSAPLAAIKAKAPNATVTFYDGTNATAAATAAASADVAIVFATQWETEGADLSSLSLPSNTTDSYNESYDQNALITAVAAQAKRVIIVLENGSPVLMPWISNVHGVLESWYPGVQGGPAIADLLFGDANPSGKLPLTFPVQDADLPQQTISATDTTVTYSEGLFMGYKWYDGKQITPLFPFGFGLSYTNYTYSSLNARADSSGNVTVTFNVQNSGSRAGSEIAEVYAALPTGLGEPPKRLVGWQKVALQPGQSQQVSVTVPPKLLSTWDATNHVWKLNSGAYQMIAGASSRDSNALTTSVNIH